MKFDLDKTSEACPEQYDVYLGERMVGYIMLRHGQLYAVYPDIYGETVYEYEFSDKLKGSFESEEERNSYLTKCLLGIKKNILDEMVNGGSDIIEYVLK